MRTRGATRNRTRPRLGWERNPTPHLILGDQRPATSRRAGERAKQSDASALPEALRARDSAALFISCDSVTLLSYRCDAQGPFVGDVHLRGVVFCVFCLQYLNNFASSHPSNFIHVCQFAFLDLRMRHVPWYSQDPGSTERSVIFTLNVYSFLVLGPVSSSIC